jgi:hypothetical protein
VLIIRHGEKPKSGPELTAAGAARAKAYVGYFKNLRVDGRPFPIDDLIATADGKKSHRERLTLEPLSAALHRPLDMRFKDKQFGDLVDDLKVSDHGKHILICWHHGNIPAMIDAFGGNASKLIPGGKWPEETFDWLVELKFDSSGHLLPNGQKLIHEHLMPGDSK